jgi:hypothetical protein
MVALDGQKSEIGDLVGERFVADDRFNAPTFDTVAFDREWWARRLPIAAFAPDGGAKSLCQVSPGDPPMVVVVAAVPPSEFAQSSLERGDGWVAE